MNGQAQADYNQALRLAPRVRDTYVSIAQNGFSSFSDFQDAIVAMGKAIDLSPNDPSLYEARGNIYLTAKQYTDAYSDYKKAIAVAPYKAAQSSINADLANVYAGQGDYDQAFSYMRKAISLQAGNAHLYVVSGNIHRDAGHFTDAIGLYTQVFNLTKRGPDVEAAHEGIGDALAGKGQTAEAIAEYQQAMHFTKDTAALKAKIKQTQHAAQS
jgi:tetratricopeptide (TPR) repeat protein